MQEEADLVQDEDFLAAVVVVIAAMRHALDYLEDVCRQKAELPEAPPAPTPAPLRVVTERSERWPA